MADYHEQIPEKRSRLDSLEGLTPTGNGQGGDGIYNQEQPTFDNPLSKLEQLVFKPSPSHNLKTLMLGKELANARVETFPNPESSFGYSLPKLSFSGLEEQEPQEVQIPSYGSLAQSLKQPQGPYGGQMQGNMGSYHGATRSVPSPHGNPYSYAHGSPGYPNMMERQHSQGSNQYPQHGQPSSTVPNPQYCERDMNYYGNMGMPHCGPQYSQNPYQNSPNSAPSFDPSQYPIEQQDFSQPQKKKRGRPKKKKEEEQANNTDHGGTITSISGGYPTSPGSYNASGNATDTYQIGNNIPGDYTLQNLDMSLTDRFLSIEKNLSITLSKLEFGHPVKYIYDPINYAWMPHCNYVKKFCQGKKKVLFLGMNPGPYGMAQTGVPFGEINIVKDWLQVSGHVGRPPVECPKREIRGFDCERSEISGSRFWGLFKNLCGHPEVFFKNCLVYNMCPLMFMKDSGKNITPPDLKVEERRPLLKICDDALVEVVRLLEVEFIIGVGKFAEERAKTALDNTGIQGVHIASILHPSPASPTANKGWDPLAHQQLQDMGVLNLITDTS